MTGEEHAILELKVSNWRERLRRACRGSSRISLWRRWRPRLCSIEWSKEAQNEKQANRDDLHSLSSEKTRQIYFRNKCGTYQRVYVAIPSNSTAHQSTSTVRIQALYL